MKLIASAFAYQAVVVASAFAYQAVVVASAFAYLAVIAGIVDKAKWPWA